MTTTPGTVDISTFTPEQKAAFAYAAKLGSGVPTFDTTQPPEGPFQPAKAPTVPTTPTTPETRPINSTEGGNANGNTGTWQTNPSTGINEFVPAGGKPSWQSGPTVGAVDDKGNAVLSDQGDRQALVEAQNAYQTAATSVHDTISGITNGSIPLSASDQAQVEGLKQQFQQLIDQQTLTNTGAAGIANTRGYQSGAAEYDPTFQIKTIQSIVTAGANKISDLQVKEASAVAALTQALKDNKIKGIQAAWDIYQKAYEDKQSALKDVIKQSSDAIQKAKDDKQKADDKYYDEVTKPIHDIALEAAKNGADAATLLKIQNAQDVNSAIAAAGNTLQNDKTSVIEANGRKLLINSQTGETIKDLGSSASSKGTVGERQDNAVSTLNSYIATGTPLADGTPVLDTNGYMTPKAWKALISQAPSEGLNRIDFIKQFGNYLYTENGKVSPEYGITPAEMKIVTGALPE